MPPPHLCRDGRRAADLARRGIRLSLRGVRCRRHDRPARRTAHSSRVSLGVSGDISAGRRQRSRDHGLIHRRQLAARHRRAEKCARSMRAPARCDGRGIRFRRIPKIRHTRRGATAAPRKQARRTSGRSSPPIRRAISIFVPTSSAAPDYYGALRLGDNRYANSIVALRASTGRIVWHFQTVHHDLWDYDNASPPALVTIHARRQIHSRRRCRRPKRACCSSCIGRPACRSFPLKNAKSRRARSPAKRHRPLNRSRRSRLR